MEAERLLVIVPEPLDIRRRERGVHRVVGQHGGFSCIRDSHTSSESALFGVCAGLAYCRHATPQGFLAATRELARDMPFQRPSPAVRERPSPRGRARTPAQQRANAS